MKLLADDSIKEFVMIDMKDFRYAQETKVSRTIAYFENRLQDLEKEGKETKIEFDNATEAERERYLRGRLNYLRNEYSAIRFALKELIPNNFMCEVDVLININETQPDSITTGIGRYGMFYKIHGKDGIECVSMGKSPEYYRKKGYRLEKRVVACHLLIEMKDGKYTYTIAQVLKTFKSRDYRYTNVPYDCR